MELWPQGCAKDTHVVTRIMLQGHQCLEVCEGNAKMKSCSQQQLKREYSNITTANTTDGHIQRHFSRGRYLHDEFMSSSSSASLLHCLDNLAPLGISLEPSILMSNKQYFILKCLLIVVVPVDATYLTSTCNISHSLPCCCDFSFIYRPLKSNDGNVGSILLDHPEFT